MPSSIRIIRPLSRKVTRPVSILTLVAWVATMGAMINRSYLQASSRNLATDLASYGSTAQWRSATAVVFMAFALVGLACGLGARYPRFAADNPSQVAGSYGGVAFMILAVLFILVMIVLLGWPSNLYLFAQFRGRALTTGEEIFIAAMFTVAAILSVATWLLGMRAGVRALQMMDRTPS